MKDHIAVVGSGGGIGEVLVGSLVSTSAEVLFLDTDQWAVDRAAAVGVDARTIDPSDGAALDREDIGTVETAIVAAFADVGVEAVCVPTALAAALDRRRREQEATDASNRAVEASRRAETVAGTERTERRVRADRHRFDENERGSEQ